MTLVLSLANSTRFVLQVSDRQLTNTRNRREFDSVSNKTLVYFARDALVAIGYCGLAYIDGFPTDQWIAQVLTDVMFPGPGERLGTRFGSRAQLLDIGQSAELLRHKCTVVCQALRLGRHPQKPQLVVAGWQAGRRAWRPILWTIEYSKAEAAYVIDRTPRYGWWERGERLLSIVPDASSIRDEDASEMTLEPVLSPAAAEQLLVSAVRSVARRDSTVGPHCMSVLLPPPPAQVVRTRYLPLTEGRAVIEDKQRRIEVPGAVRPWIIAPTVVAPPAVIVGSGHEIVANAFGNTFRLVTEAPDVVAGSGVLAAMSSQRSPSPTQR
jgi:hypothetical protein